MKKPQGSNSVRFLKVRFLVHQVNLYSSTLIISIESGSFRSFRFFELPT